MEIPSLPPSTLRSFTPYLVEEDPDFDVLVLDAHGSAVEVRNRADRVQGPLSRADVFFFQGEIYIYISLPDSRLFVETHSLSVTPSGGADVLQGGCCLHTILGLLTTRIYDRLPQQTTFEGFPPGNSPTFSIQ